MSEPMVAVSRAVSECRAVARAVAALGGRASPADIARVADLPLRTVTTRLNNSGPKALPNGFRWFHRGDGGLWGLTLAGAEMAAGDRA